MREENVQNNRMRPRWRQEMPGLFFGLVLVLLGVIFFLAAQGAISWGDWWKYFLIGLGGIFVIQALVSYVYPAFRMIRLGRLVFGIILILIGLGFLGGFGTWWPLILVAVGLAVLLNAWLRRR